MNSKKQKLFCRIAKLQDVNTFYTWTNDAQVRKNSLNGKKNISYNLHIKWFKKKILDRNCTLFIFSIKDIDIGQVRFDKKNKIVTISYSVSKRFRSKGFGKRIFRMAIKKYKPKNNYILVGKVRRSNLSSVKVFKSSGFTSKSESKIHFFKKNF